VWSSVYQRVAWFQIQSDSFVGDSERQRRALSQDVPWPSNSSLQAVIALLRLFFLGCLLGSFWSLESARASVCRFGSGSQMSQSFCPRKRDGSTWITGGKGQVFVSLPKLV
jgi:hypothetical protein